MSGLLAGDLVVLNGERAVRGRYAIGDGYIRGVGLEVQRIGGTLFELNLLRNAGDFDLLKVALAPRQEAGVCPVAVVVRVGSHGIDDQLELLRADDVQADMFRLGILGHDRGGVDLLVVHPDLKPGFAAGFGTVAGDAAQPVEAEIRLKDVVAEALDVIDDFGGSMDAQAAVELRAFAVDRQLHRAAFEVGAEANVFPARGGGLPCHVLQRDFIHLGEADGIHLRVAVQVVDADLRRVVKGRGLFHFGLDGGMRGDRFHMREFRAGAQIGDGVLVLVQREIGQGAAVHLDAVERLGDDRLLCLLHLLFDGIRLTGDRTHPVGEGILPVGQDLVFFQHGRAAAAVAKAGLHVVQGQIDLVCPGELVWMRLAVQLGSGIVQRAELHRGVGGEQDAVARLVRQGDPADVRAVAVLLRLEVRHKHAVHGVVIHADRGTGLAVHIVFFRPSAVVGDVLIACGQFHLHTHAAQHFGRLGVEFAVDHDVARGVHGVGDDIGGIVQGGIGERHGDDDLMLVLLHCYLADGGCRVAVLGVDGAVVDPCAPVVRLRRIVDQFLAVVLKGGQLALGGVEGDLKALALGRQRVAAFRDLGERRGGVQYETGLVCVKAQFELLERHGGSLVRPEGILFQAELDVEQEFAAFAHGFGRVIADGHHFGLAARDVELLVRQNAGLDDLIVVVQCPNALVLVQIGEVEEVFDLDLAGFEVFRRELDALIGLFDLLIGGMQGAVGEYNAVSAEVAVVGVVAPVAAVAEIPLLVFAGIDLLDRIKVHPEDDAVVFRRAVFVVDLFERERTVIDAHIVDLSLEFAAGTLRIGADGDRIIVGGDRLLGDLFAGAELAVDVDVDGARVCVKCRDDLMPVLEPVVRDGRFKADPGGAGAAGRVCVVDEEFHHALAGRCVADVLHRILAVALCDDGAVGAAGDLVRIDKRFQGQAAGQVQGLAHGQGCGAFQSGAVADAVAGFQRAFIGGVQPQGAVVNQLVFGIHCAEITPEQDGFVVGRNARIRDLLRRQCAVINAHFVDQAGEFTARALQVFTHRDGIGVGIAHILAAGGYGFQFHAVHIDLQGAVLCAEDAGDPVPVVEPVRRCGDRRRDPGTAALVAEFQVALGVLQRKLLVALGNDGVVAFRIFARLTDKRFHGEAAGRVKGRVGGQLCGALERVVRVLACNQGAGEFGLELVVAAVGQDVLLIAAQIDADGLVYPVPNAAANQLVVFFKDIHIFLEVAGAVAHGVCIFMRKVGLGVVVRPDGRQADAPGEGAVHGRIGGGTGVRIGGIAVASGIEVVDRARVVARFDPVVQDLEHRTRAGLIAHGPHDHAGVVLVALDHALHAVEMDIRPFFRVVAGDLMHGAVRLDVGFVDDVHAVFVAQFIPIGVVRIVRCADGVDIGLLHQDDVLLHQFAADGAARVRRSLVAVKALHDDIFAIDKQAGVVAQLHLAEADPGAGKFHAGARLVAQFQNQCV